MCTAGQQQEPGGVDMDPVQRTFQLPEQLCGSWGQSHGAGLLLSRQARPAGLWVPEIRPGRWAGHGGQGFLNQGLRAPAVGPPRPRPGHSPNPPGA